MVFLYFVIYIGIIELPAKKINSVHGQPVLCVAICPPYNNNYMAGVYTTNIQYHLYDL